MQDSGLEVDEDNRHRVGVIFGSGGGGMELVIHWDDVMKTRGARRVSPFRDAESDRRRREWPYRDRGGRGPGPNYSPTSACATGANAVADGMLHIGAGRADALIVGGSEAIILPLFHACFERMGVLASPAEPFDGILPALRPAPQRLRARRGRGGDDDRGA